MGLKKNLLKQCRKPKGFLGKLVARKMNEGHSELASWGLQYISIHPNDIILDIGCGGGQNVYDFAQEIQGGKVYGIDYSDVSVKISSNLNKIFIESGNVEIQKANVSSLPFPENKFDLITGFETYYFWPDLIHDLIGIRKVLKPGGKLLLVNEVFKCKNKTLRKRNEYWAENGDFPIHTPDEIRHFLEKAEFSDINIHIEENEEYIAALAMK